MRGAQAGNSTRAERSHHASITTRPFFEKRYTKGVMNFIKIITGLEKYMEDHCFSFLELTI